ncbi:MAG: GTP cyclohydrolase [Aquificae bacterium]|nr:GTP cyclohydrolase [Aquificota bacterium]
MEKLIKSWENLPLPPEELERKREKLRRLFEEVLTVLGYDWKNDPNMVDTPRRMAGMLLELVEGNFSPMPPITTFDLSAMDGAPVPVPVFVGPIEIKSLCSHHFLPVVGRVYFEYLPSERVLGLSKIPRVIKWLARRPMIQELFTRQVIKTFKELLPETKGMAVYVKAKHMCMTVRGVNESGAYMVTEAFDGLYEKDENLRANFLRKVGE